MEKPRIVGGHVALDLVNTVAPRPADDEAVDWLASPGALLHWAQRVDLVTAAEAQSVSAAWGAAPARADRARLSVVEIREALYVVLTAALSSHEVADSSGPTSSGTSGVAADELVGASHGSAVSLDRAGPVAESDVSPDRAGSVAESDVSAALGRLMLGWAGAAGRSVLRPGRRSEPPAVLEVGSPGALLIPDRLADAAVDLVRTVDLTQLRACPVAEGGCGWLFLDRSRNHSRRWCTMDDCGTHAKSRRLTSRRRTARIAQR